MTSLLSSASLGASSPLVSSSPSLSVQMAAGYVQALGLVPDEFVRDPTKGGRAIGVPRRIRFHIL